MKFAVEEFTGLQVERNSWTPVFRLFYRRTDRAEFLDAGVSAVLPAYRPGKFPGRRYQAK